VDRSIAGSLVGLLTKEQQSDLMLEINRKLVFLKAAATMKNQDAYKKKRVVQEFCK
jgi:hypothetical protein